MIYLENSDLTLDLDLDLDLDLTFRFGLNKIVEMSK